MNGGLLVAAHLSSLFSSQATSIALQTARQKIPLPSIPKDSDLLLEHAAHSSVLHTPFTGTILLRVLHGGLIVELISLSTEVPPIRFVFPAKVLPCPGIFLWDDAELHILAVTDIGSLYRLVIPVEGGRELWQNQVDNIWPREYYIENIPETLEGFVHVQGMHCILITTPNGSVLRLDAEHLEGDGFEELWLQNVLQETGVLLSFKSFLNSAVPGASDIVSIATHPWPTDIRHIWTLSRDRTLKAWKATGGCAASHTLVAFSGREASPVPGTSQNGARSHMLLEAEHQTLLRVFTSSNDGVVYVLAFMPTISSSTSGGSFQLLAAEQLSEIGTIECSRNSAHCHLQDFIIVGNTLYTLWDHQGQSMVEKTVMTTEMSNQEGLRFTPWQTASYAPEAELTPAYLEEQLLLPGSLTDKFFEAIMRPGMFSALTLRTAIDQYTDACLSLPGPPPPQLTTTYATIGENIAAVVGCTVNLNRDPHTGDLQYTNYWNALKRDWEGFIARCREVERSARWPLILGAQDQGEIIVVERERVGSLVNEDLPIHLRRLLSREHPSLDPQYDLLSVLWTLRSRLGPQVVLSLENRLVDIMHQEIAFSFADILQDQARRFKFREALDEGSASWIIGRLQSIDDLDAATRLALDVIGGFDMEIKREEDEVELLLPPPHSDWSRALAAAFVTTTVTARYDLCLSLITLLFFLSEELGQWDPALLAEVFAVFRGVAILRFVARHPAENAPPPAGDLSPDDVISRMRNMNVSHSRNLFTPTYSLIHRLLAQSGDTHGLPGAAHRFLDATGLLQSVSPAHATKYEVLFCERLRLLGFYDGTRELLSWLPRTSGVTYVLARLLLNLGRADDASHLMEKLAGNLGPNNALSAEDQVSLASVLPSGEAFDSEFAFYIHASNIFKHCGLTRHEVLFAQLAISVAPPSGDTAALWHIVIKGYIELGYYDNAYAALMATPHERQKRECVSQLTYRMCEDNEVQTLMAFNFAGISDEVEDALAFKARNVDPRLRPCYSKILHTWYIRRGDYRNAALIMYQRARKYQDIVPNSLSLSFAEEQLEAYLVAINALSLVDERNAWIVLPPSLDSGSEPTKRRKLSRHIPEGKYASGKYDTELIHLSDMQDEYALLSAQVDMIQRDPTLLTSSGFLLSASLIVLRLAQANRFNQALATARSLKVDMSDLFAHLTGQCLRLSRNSNAVIQEDTSDWLLTDKVSSWPGTPADRGWRYLRQSLERHDSFETDFRYTKTTLETILAFDNTTPPPPWLIHKLQEHHHEYLIRITLRYETLEHAIEHAISLIRNADTRLAREPQKTAASTWLPYSLFDQVVAAGLGQETPPPRLSELQAEISNRVKRMQKLSQQSS